MIAKHIGLFIGMVSVVRTSSAALVPYPATDALKGAMAPYRLAAGKYVHAEAMPAEDGVRLPNEVPFLLYTPERPKTGKVPLVVFLPGNGEKGPDLVQQFRQRTIFEKVTGAAFQKRHPCYLLALSPPAAAGTLLDGLPGEPSPVQKLLFGAIEEVAKTRKGPQVDFSRIYLTGLSYGAGGVYGLMTSYPGRFAAGVPVATFPPPAFFAETGKPLRIWHLYNEGDWAASGLSEAQTRPFADAVRAGGGEFRLSTYPATGHNAWDAAWREDPVWDWMFTQGARGDGNGMAHGRIPDPTRRVGGGGEKHAESAESAEIRPPAVTASKPGRDGRTGPERALDGLDGTAYVSASPVAAGDWLQVEWSAPVQGRVEVRTGLSDGTLRLSKGRVEVSADGKMWSRVGTVSGKTGVCAFQQRTGIRFLRLLPEPRLPESLAVREIAVKP